MGRARGRARQDTLETGRATQREGGRYSQQDEVREDPSFSSVWKVFLYNKNALQKKRGIRSKVRPFFRLRSQLRAVLLWLQVHGGRTRK